MVLHGATQPQTGPAQTPAVQLVHKEQSVAVVPHVAGDVGWHDSQYSLHLVESVPNSSHRPVTMAGPHIASTAFISSWITYTNDTNTITTIIIALSCFVIVPLSLSLSIYILFLKFIQAQKFFHSTFLASLRYYLYTCSPYSPLFSNAITFY